LTRCVADVHADGELVVLRPVDLFAVEQADHERVLSALDRLHCGAGA
jgi:hypothetical protein